MKRLSIALFLALFCAAAMGQQSYREIQLAVSGAVTATGASATTNTTPYAIVYQLNSGLAVINVSAVSGTTPSATFTIEGIINGINYTLGTCSALTAAGKCVLTLAAIPASVRVAYAISGTTPSFTYEAWLVRQ